MRKRIKLVLSLGLFAFLFLGIFTPTSFAADNDWQVDLNVRDNGTGSLTPDNIVIGMAQEPDNFIDPPYPPSPFFAWSIEKGTDDFMELIVEFSEEYSWKTEIVADSSQEDRDQVQPVITWSSKNLPQDKEVLMFVDGDVVDLKKDERYVWENMQWSYDRAYLEPKILASSDVDGYPLKIEDFQIRPKLVEPGETVSVSAEVTNKSNETLERDVTLFINGNVESSDSIELSGNQSETLDFNISRNQEKSYDVQLNIGNETREGEFRVRKILEEGSFEITNLEVIPKKVRLGDNVEITGEVKNVGDVSKEQVLALYVDNEVEDYEVMELSGGESEGFVFITSREKREYYRIRVETGKDSWTDNFLVEEYVQEEDVKIENLTLSTNEVDSGQTVTVSGQVRNNGEIEQSFGIFFYVDNGQEGYIPSMELDSGENGQFEFEISRMKEGSYEVSVKVLGEEEVTSFSVIEEQGTPKSGLVTVFVLAVIVLTIILAFVLGKDRI